MSTVRPESRPVKPVVGAVRSIINNLGGGTPSALAINGAPYWLTVLTDGGRTVGYRLQKEDGTTYDIDATQQPWACECPDFQYRRAGKDPKGWKHIAGL